MKGAKATIRIDLPSAVWATIVLGALKPETETSPTQRSKVKIECDGRVIVLHFKAKDTTALRASMNSYTRWVMLVEDALSKVESF